MCKNMEKKSKIFLNSTYFKCLMQSNIGDPKIIMSIDGQPVRQIKQIRTPFSQNASIYWI